MPNRLAHETSPYLLQHAENPVDWWPWSPEALERARAENKPILLSIGYAACHWCHVMAHESFEDPATAAFMNERFINIKVDREERPDLDAIYMQAVQAMTGHGGWPMTVFLTPDGVPFYGGTYYPKDDRQGMPSFTRIMRSLSDAYRERPADIARTVASVREMYVDGRAMPGAPGGAVPLTRALLDGAYHALAERYDERFGGFEGAPKFPQAMSLDFLVTYWGRTGTEQALAIATNSFLAMARGGIYDQIGGGFARYSVDDRWLVPHFEKMLYDNALLARLGVHLWQASANPEIRRVVEETLDWAVREMRAPEGGFYSSLDADSEGHEGKFYVWSADELDAALGDDAPLLREYWGVTADGKFEGKNILFVADVDRRALAARHALDDAALDARVASAKRLLYDIRSARVWPGLDDKVLASWNGLMVRAFADAARAFDDARYRAIAVESAAALFGSMVKNGRVFRSSKAGRARIAGYLEDYASLALTALALYELTFDETWIERARTLADSIDTWFRDDDTGLYFDTASDQETLITRPREVTDNATPAGTSLAAELFVRLAELTGDDALRRRAAAIVDRLAPAAARYPMAFGHLLSTADLLINGAIEVAIAGAPESAAFRELARVVGARFVPGLVLAGGQGSSLPLLAGRAPTAGVPAAFVCRNYACELPVTDPTALDDQLAEAARASGG
jgi:uncharacterized protein